MNDSRGYERMKDKNRQGDTVKRGREDGETRRHGDGRRGDMETKTGDGAKAFGWIVVYHFLCVSPSPRPRVPASPCLRLPASPCRML